MGLSVYTNKDLAIIESNSNELFSACKNTFESKSVALYLEKKQAESSLKVSALFFGSAEEMSAAAGKCSELATFFSVLGFGETDANRLVMIFAELTKVTGFENTTFDEILIAFKFALSSKFSLTTYNKKIDLIYIRDVLLFEKENNHVDFFEVNKVKARLELESEKLEKPKIITDFERFYNSCIYLIKLYESFIVNKRFGIMKYIDSERLERGAGFQMFSKTTEISFSNLETAFTDFERVAKCFPFIESFILSKKERFEIYESIYANPAKNLAKLRKIAKQENSDLEESEIFEFSKENIIRLCRIIALEKTFNIMKDSDIGVYEFAGELGLSANKIKNMNYLPLQDYTDFETFLKSGNIKKLMSLQPFSENQFSFHIKEKKLALDNNAKKLQMLVSFFSNSVMSEKECATVLGAYSRNHSKDMQVREFAGFFGEQNSVAIMEYWEKINTVKPTLSMLRRLKRVSFKKFFS